MRSAEGRRPVNLRLTRDSANRGPSTFAKSNTEIDENSTRCYGKSTDEPEGEAARVFKTAWFAKAYSSVSEKQLSRLLDDKDLTEICRPDEAKIQK
jgi:hypothetical protein